MKNKFFLLLFSLESALDCSLILLISSKRIDAWSLVLEAQMMSTPPLDKKNSARSIPATKVVFPFLRAMSNIASVNLLKPVSEYLNPYAV